MISSNKVILSLYSWNFTNIMDHIPDWVKSWSLSCKSHSVLCSQSKYLKVSGDCSKDKSNSFAGFSKQNYYEKIDKNQRKNIKITKHYRQGG